jgi:uncharacterized membrane protein YdfJ with MMPL/SSD domain
MAFLFDATIVRGLLGPAVVTLLGERNWYLPRRLDRVLSNVKPGLRLALPTARRLASRRGQMPSPGLD